MFWICDLNSANKALMFLINVGEKWISIALKCFRNFIHMSDFSSHLVWLVQSCYTWPWDIHDENTRRICVLNIYHCINKKIILTREKQCALLDLGRILSYKKSNEQPGLINQAALTHPRAILQLYLKLWLGQFVAKYKLSYFWTTTLCFTSALFICAADTFNSGNSCCWAYYWFSYGYPEGTSNTTAQLPAS